MGTEISHSCIGPSDAYAFAAGGLAADQRSVVRDNLADCGGCRAIVAEAVRQARSDGEEAHAETVADNRPLAPSRSNIPQPGLVIHRYRVEKLVGAGGMGVVVLAQDTQLARPVVLKLIRPELADPSDTRGARARLLREAQAMAQLSHPNVVQVYDIGNHGSEIFIAMEFLAAGNLRDWLRRKKRSQRDILSVFAAAGRGLAAAHQAGIIHRDFKPANVVMSPSGKVKVTDFGLARTRGDGDWKRSPSRAIQTVGQALDSDLTQSGALVGTPTYMSPEQLEGISATAASDQYSFCIALYEALTGELPFVNNLETESSSGVLIGPADARLQPRIRRALRRGLSPSPSNRFRSIEDLLAALRPKRTTASQARRRLGLGLAASVLALAFLASAAAMWKAERGENVLADIKGASDVERLVAARAYEQRVERAVLIVHQASAGPDAARAARALEEIARSESDLAPGVAAEGLFAAGTGFEILGDFASSERVLLEALQLGELANDHVIRARVYLQLIYIKRRTRRFAEAIRWFTYAEAAIERIGTDSGLEAKLLDLKAQVHGDRGDPAEAMRLRRHAVAKYENGTPDERAHAGLILGDIALSLSHDHRQTDEALAELDRAEVIAGPDRLDTIAPLRKTRISVLYAAGRGADAEAERKRLIETLTAKAHLLGDHVGEKEIAAIVGAGPSQSTSSVSDRLGVELQKGYALHNKDDFRGAAVHMGRALEMAEKLHGPDSSFAISLGGALGTVESRAGHHRKAIKRLRAIHQRAVGTLAPLDHMIADIETRLSSAYRRSGRAAKAVEHAAAAHDRYVGNGMGPRYLADAEWAWAQALALDGGPTERAVELAKSALGHYRSTKRQRDIDEVSKWLAEVAGDGAVAAR